MSILPKRAIPKSLWSGEMIYMPSSVVSSYRTSLDANGIMEMALSTKTIRGPLGGPSREDTLEHFASRYGVSVCRAESLVIDPHRAFAAIPDDLLTTFSDGHLSVLDAPSGAGAAGTSLVSTIAVLRESGLVPKLPLTVKITGGDCSRHPLDLYGETLRSINPSLTSVGINVYFKPVIWDAERPETTAALIDDWFRDADDAEEFFAVVANFSGVAGKSFEKFKRSFEHIHERLHDKTSSVLWVEPGMKGAKSYFKKIATLMGFADWFTSRDKSAYEYLYSWFHPFQRRKLNCRVIVRQYARTR